MLRKSKKYRFEWHIEWLLLRFSSLKWSFEYSFHDVHIFFFFFCNYSKLCFYPIIGSCLNEKSQIKWHVSAMWFNCLPFLFRFKQVVQPIFTSLVHWFVQKNLFTLTNDCTKKKQRTEAIRDIFFAKKKKKTRTRETEKRKRNKSCTHCCYTTNIYFIN